MGERVGAAGPERMLAVLCDDPDPDTHEIVCVHPCPFGGSSRTTGWIAARTDPAFANPMNAHA